MFYSSFPHPVLGNRNDVLSEFKLLDHKCHPLAQMAHVRFSVGCRNDQLEALIESGEAAFAITWDCPATMSRGLAVPHVTKKRYGWDIRFSLLQDEIKGAVHIDPALIATKEIRDFAWDAQNPVYGDSRFTISSGDILGILNGFTFAARKISDALEPPLGSLFQIIPCEEPDPIAVEYEADEQIVVKISEEIAQRLNILGNGRLDATVIALVVFPVLVDAINLMHGCEQDSDLDDYSHKSWFRTLKERIDDADLDTGNAVGTAQLLLSEITNQALCELAALEGDDV